MRLGASSQTQQPPTRLCAGGGTVLATVLVPPLSTPPCTLTGRAGKAPGGSEAGPTTVPQELGVARRCGPSEGRLAPSPPPTPAGCRGGAQRQPSLPGPRSRKRGRQHASVRALAPDSRLPTQIRAWGLNPRTGGLQSRPGEDKTQSSGGGACMSLPASSGQAREPVCFLYSKQEASPTPRAVLYPLMVTMHGRPRPGCTMPLPAPSPCSSLPPRFLPASGQSQCLCPLPEGHHSSPLVASPGRTVECQRTQEGLECRAQAHCEC